MFFEDEKDFIESGADIQISEDGTVTWEEVLNDSDDEIVSVKSAAMAKKQDQQGAPIDLGDELELVQSDDDIDDQQLTEILTNNTEENPKQKAFDAFGGDNESEEDFDIDSQLANVVLEQNKQDSSNQEETIKPRKTEQKKSFNLMPVLLSALFAILVAGGIYYYITQYTGDKNLNQEALEIPATKQDEMNNINQEELAQRNEEIPVVNEEEASEIKPEEEEQPQEEEKKQVINVVQTGRANPFMPISKYISVSIPKANIDFDHSGIPKPPETYGIQDEVTTKLMTIAVSGIMYDEVKPSAIITFDNNDYFVQKGDKLDDYRVIDIAKNYVTIALGKNIYKANIGEEFKISSEFYGSAQFLPQKQGGGRQYHSVSDQAEKQQYKESSSKRYVSEDDVIINAR